MNEFLKNEGNDSYEVRIDSSFYHINSRPLICMDPTHNVWPNGARGILMKDCLHPDCVTRYIHES